MELGEAVLELHMRLVGAADEPHRSRSRAEGANRLLLCRHHRGVPRQAEVAVGAHPDERLVAVAGQQIAGPPPSGRWQHRRHDSLDTLARAAGVHLD